MSLPGLLSKDQRILKDNKIWKLVDTTPSYTSGNYITANARDFMTNVAPVGQHCTVACPGKGDLWSGKGIEAFYLLDNRPQKKWVTTLKRSKCNINDQTIPQCLSAPIDPSCKMYDRRTDPVAYHTHKSKFDIFPQLEPGRFDTTGSPVLPENTTRDVTTQYWNLRGNPRNKADYPDLTGVIHNKHDAGEYGMRIHLETHTNAPDLDSTKSVADGGNSEFCYGEPQAKCNCKDYYSKQPYRKVHELRGRGETELPPCGIAAPATKPPVSEMCPVHNKPASVFLQRRELNRMKNEAKMGVCLNRVLKSAKENHAISETTEFMNGASVVRDDLYPCNNVRVICPCTKTLLENMCQRTTSPKIHDCGDNVENKDGNEKTTVLKCICPFGEHLFQLNVADGSRQVQVNGEYDEHFNKKVKHCTAPEWPPQKYRYGKVLKIAETKTFSGRSKKFPTKLISSVFNTKLPNVETSGVEEQGIYDNISGTEERPTISKLMEKEIQKDFQDRKRDKNSISSRYLTYVIPDHRCKPVILEGNVQLSEYPHLLADFDKKRNAPILYSPIPISHTLAKTGNRIVHKLGLPYRTEIIRRFHEQHPKPVPVLSDNITPGRKHMFHGFHSTILRGQAYVPLEVSY